MKNQKAMWIGVAVLGVIFIIANACFVYGTTETVSITVANTERITTGSGDTLSSKYLVFTSGETFENSDTIWYAKWNSSDIQGRLQAGQTYSAKVYGWRIPFMSTYRNIVEVETK